MSEKVIERISQITKALYKLNLVSVVLCFIMWISSTWYAISMGLKHGISFQVITTIEGITRTTTQNTIFNLAMAGIFTWMMITAFLSFVYLITMYRSNEVEEP